MVVFSKPPPLHFLEWESQINDIIARSAPSARRVQTKTLLEKYTTNEKGSSVQKGHAIMDRMRALLNTFRRSEQQKQFHHIMLRCLAKQVYLESIWTHELEILEYNGFDSLNTEVMVSAPRRFGKSWGVAMLACVVLLCVPHCELSIFASNKRAAGGDTGMSSIIRKFLLEHFKVPKEKFYTDNSEHIFLKFPGNDIRKLNAYPGSVSFKVISYI